MSQWSPEDPPLSPPRRPRSRVELFDRTLQLDLKRGGLASAAFLILWLIAWTAGCVFLAGEVLRKPSAHTILFGVPFWASWFLVAAIVLNMLFGRELLTISPEGLSYEWRVFWPLRRRPRVTIESIIEVTGFATQPDSDSGKRQFGIEILSTHEPIRLAKGYDEQEELPWLADLIRRHLHALGQHHPAGQGSPQFLKPDSAAPARASCSVEVLRRVTPPLEKPAGAAWHLQRDFNRTVFTSRGPKLSEIIGAAAMLTFLVAFWDGIVAVFVLQLFAKFSWFLFFFLIPFEVIGLFFLGLWAFAILSPFMRIAYGFNPGEIRFKSTILGIGRTRHIVLNRLSRVEMRRELRRLSRIRSPLGEAEGDKRPFKLALVGTDGQDVLEIADLTEAEARWIADELFNDFRNWHVPVGA